MQNLWHQFTADFTWQIFALIAFLYIVLSNFVPKNIAELVKVTKAVDDLKPMLGCEPINRIPKAA